jgi:CheY-like chemotaxis protein
MVEKEAEKKTGVILVLLDNLFFASKINQAAGMSGFETDYAKNAEQALTRARAGRPRLIIVDLNANTGFPLDFIKQLKSDEQLKNIPVIGFVSHVNVELQEQARAAGCDRVLVRSVFEQSLIRLLDGMK